MKIYIKYLTITYLKSFLNTFMILFSLIFILNILQEIEFFSDKNVNSFYPIYLSLMNSPSIIYEIFPFVFLISTQFFFIKLFNNDEIDVFKYSGLKNFKIITIISLLSFFLGLFIILIFYTFSSNLQSYYLKLKNQYTNDQSYLAVINKNGLWIKDIVNNKTSIINSGLIENNFLKETLITTFDKNYNPITNIKSNKIDIKNNKWLIYDASVFEEDKTNFYKIYEFETNFNLEMIRSLFSNLSSLSIIELFELRKNYNSLNYSVVDINMQINKVLSYPIFLSLMTILSSIIMLGTKKLRSNTLKIVIGLFCSVIIYYIINFFNVMGSTEKINIFIAIWAPLIILTTLNSSMLIRINEK